MISVNLLPWREGAFAKQKQQLLWMLCLGLLTTLMLLGVSYGVLLWRIGQQRAGNAYLQQQIHVLKPQKRKQKKWLQRKTVLLEQIKQHRTQQAAWYRWMALLQQLGLQLPAGVVLRSLQKKQDEVHFYGVAASNEGVSVLMQRLLKLKHLRQARLLSSQWDKAHLNYQFHIAASLSNKE